MFKKTQLTEKIMTAGVFAPSITKYIFIFLKRLDKAGPMSKWWDQDDTGHDFSERRRLCTELRTVRVTAEKSLIQLYTSSGKGNRSIFSSAVMWYTTVRKLLTSWRVA